MVQFPKPRHNVFFFIALFKPIRRKPVRLIGFPIFQLFVPVAELLGRCGVNCLPCFFFLFIIFFKCMLALGFFSQVFRGLIPSGLIGWPSWIFWLALVWLVAGVLVSFIRPTRIGRFSIASETGSLWIRQSLALSSYADAVGAVGAASFPFSPPFSPPSAECKAAWATGAAPARLGRDAAGAKGLIRGVRSADRVESPSARNAG